MFNITKTGKVAGCSGDDAHAAAQNEYGERPAEEEACEIAISRLEILVFTAGPWQTRGQFGRDEALHESHAADGHPQHQDVPRGGNQPGHFTRRSKYARADRHADAHAGRRRCADEPSKGTLFTGVAIIQRSIIFFQVQLRRAITLY